MKTNWERKRGREAGTPPGLQAVCRKNTNNVKVRILGNVSVSCLSSAQWETGTRLISFCKVTANIAMVILAWCQAEVVGPEKRNPCNLALNSLDVKDMQQKPFFPKVFPDLPFYLSDPHLELLTLHVASGSLNSQVCVGCTPGLLSNVTYSKVEQQRSLKEV